MEGELMLPALILAQQLYLFLLSTPDTPLGEDFQDLGTLMLAAFVGAVLVALALTFVRFRLRDRKPQTSSFISINTERQDE
jgi:hypothetical protein